ncbi:hypothetical protein BDN72DRAFT_830459 [Pluteus cervinus]|uniref:Uncharacterized protein n=1 Tax=Pluteus cervinus TaxID=181527 RepID=A0ACD3BHZ2_9AGAR|nr:hypothetical protein BDN72DRAFT_830459 [Pluteus cervinus]
MVSALWKAASEGNLQAVNELLKDASIPDIELKDHAGFTALIEAIKNGHVDVARALLDKGADPTNASSQGPPEHFTSDPAVLDLLEAYRSKMTSHGMPIPDSAFHNDSMNPEKMFYPPPPPGYPYYPTLNGPPPAMPDGTLYYPPPPQHHGPTPPSAGEHSPGGGGNNLPPPEVARFIPCRYFPACRYGASCLFAHPQTPYFQGPMPPPAQYGPPYDPMAPHPYPPAYYPVPPPPGPAFHSPNGVHPMTPISPPPPPPMIHGRSPSELVSPSQPPFSPIGPPPPAQYGPMPPSYALHPSHVPQPLSIPPVPPMHHHPPPPLSAGPQSSPSAMYHNPNPPFSVHPDPAGQYPPQPNGMAVKYHEPNGPKSPLPNSPSENFVPSVPHRDNMNHSRRGTGRRISLRGRGAMPACLFFPSGRCKNGDDCRFPHVASDGPAPHNGFYSGRGGGPRPRPHPQFGNLEEKFANVSIRDDGPPRPPHMNGTRHNQMVNGNGPRVEKRNHFPPKQRVPNADEFPVLGGSTTPPSRANGVANGQNGPTAAQVLQAPPPIKKESSRDSRVSPSESFRSAPSKDPRPEVNGTLSESPPHEHIINGKIPATFGTIANIPDVSQEVTVLA